MFVKLLVECLTHSKYPIYTGIIHSFLQSFSICLLKNPSLLLGIELNSIVSNNSVLSQGRNLLQTEPLNKLNSIFNIGPLK